MKQRLQFLFIFFLAVPAAARAQWPESLVRATKALMKMEMKQKCKSYQENGLPLLDCEYWTSKSDRKYGRAILFDVSQEQWMSWIWSACSDIGKADAACFQAVARQIQGQSGGQIVWRGIVYEDIKPRNGVNEMYCFRQGISVAIRGLERWMTRQPTSAEIQTCFESEDIYFVGKYPRPISLAVEDWQRMTGEKGLVDSNGQSTMLWLQRISQVLPAGMGQQHLAFIDLWTRLNIKK